MKKKLHIFLVLVLSCLLQKAYCQCNIDLTTTVSKPNCYNGSNGSITCVASGGSGSYDYNLSNGTAAGWVSSNVFNGLISGNYIVSVRDHNSTTCIKTVYISIDQPDQITVTPTVTNTTCSNSTDGSVNLAIAGGTAPYTFAWMKNGTEMPGETTASLTGLTPGVYNAIVKDSKGCQQQITSSTNSTTLPISLSGFNRDIVATGSYSANTWSTNVSGPIDSAISGFSGSLFYSNGFIPNGGAALTNYGLPTSEQITSSSENRKYALASYSSNNTLRLSNGSKTTGANGTLTFGGNYQSAYQMLYVLCLSANGASSINYTVNYTNGSTSTGSFSIPDWASGSSAALSNLRRVWYANMANDEIIGTRDDRIATNLSMFEIPIDLSANNKPIASIKFENSTASRQALFFAITGTSFSNTGVIVDAGLTQSVTPTVTITPKSSNTTYCNGESFQLTASGNNLGNNPSFIWSSSGTSTTTLSSKTGSEISSTLTGSGRKTISVTVSPDPSLTCLTTSTVATSIVFNSGTVIPSISITGPSNICQNTIGSYNAIASNGGDAAVYTWYVDNVAISGVSGPTLGHSFISPGTKSVYAKLTSSIGCVSSNNVSSGTLNTMVNPNLTPSVTINGWLQPTTQGAKNTFVLNVNGSANGGVTPIYQWYNNNSLINGATSNTYYANNVSSNDLFSVLLTSNVACPTPQSVMSNYLNFPMLLPVKMSTFSLSKNANMILVNWVTNMELNLDRFEVLRSTSADFKDFVVISIKKATNNSSGSSYSFQDEISSNGNYYYKIKSVDLDGAYEMSNIRSISVNDYSVQGLKISPNPVMSTAILTGFVPGATIQIISISGALISTQKVEGNSHSIQMDNILSGIYILKETQTNGKVRIVKFIKK